LDSASARDVLALEPGRLAIR